MVTLKRINEDNWRECISLKVNESQKRFVATNENGLALAYAHKEMEPRAIYNDETMVGFLMYACDPDDGIHYIPRLMIDERFQKNGYGREAMRLLLEEFKEKNIDYVEILHKPDNDVAIKLYRSFGFELTDGKLNDDVISAVRLQTGKNN